MAYLLHARVNGDVQSRGCRGSIARIADRLGITGVAINAGDGSVRVMAYVDTKTVMRDFLKELQTVPQNNRNHVQVLPPLRLTNDYPFSIPKKFTTC